jgi:glycerol uptake facilitator-like aquaporin
MGKAISRRNCSHCDAFAGIQLADVPAFIVAQLAGAICAIFIAKWLLQPAVKTSTGSADRLSSPAE